MIKNKTLIEFVFSKNDLIRFEMSVSLIVIYISVSRLLMRLKNTVESVLWLQQTTNKVIV